MYCLIRKWIYYVLIVCLHVQALVDSNFLTIFGTVTLVPTKPAIFLFYITFGSTSLTSRFQTLCVYLAKKRSQRCWILPLKK